jgi:hypothetical protein
MPLITGVDHKRREVSVVAIGPVNVDDVRELLLHQKREGGLGYPKLVESRGAEIPSDPADLQQITEILRELSLEGPIGPAAIMVSSEADQEGIRVLEGMLHSFCNVKAFRDEAEARAWLRQISLKSQST